MAILLFYTCFIPVRKPPMIANAMVMRAAKSWLSAWLPAVMASTSTPWSVWLNRAG